MSFNSLQTSSAFLFIAIGLTYLGIGIWEANTAQNNNPKKIDYHGDMIQGYAFCVAKCVINIILGLCTSFSGCIMCCIDESSVTGGSQSSKKENKSESFIQLVSFGVGIWGLILYFNNYDLGPFQQIIFAEMIIFFIGIGLIGIMIIIACCYCCFACVSDIDDTKSFSPPLNNIPIITQQINQTQPINQTQENNKSLYNKNNTDIESSIVIVDLV